MNNETINRSVVSFLGELSPIAIFLLSIVVGVITGFCGAEVATATLVAFALQVLLTMMSMQNDLNKLKDAVIWRRDPDLLAVLEHQHQNLTSNNRWKKIVANILYEDFTKETNRLFQERVKFSVSEFMSFAEQMFGELGKGDTFWATSIYGGGKFWSQTYGEKYAHLNRDAAARGATITRIYVYDSEGQRSDLRAVMQNQQEHGIQLFMVADNDTQEVRGAVRDFFVLNHEMAAEFEFDLNMKALVCIQLYFSPGEISAKQDDFRRLKSVSTAFMPGIRAGGEMVPVAQVASSNPT